MKRTPAQERRVRQLEDAVSLHELARSVACPSCRVPVGAPCINRYDEPLPAEHPRRINQAERIEARRREQECSFCARYPLTPEQREVVPWPVELKWCAWHKRVRDEIREAREMEAGQ